MEHNGRKYRKAYAAVHIRCAISMVCGAVCGRIPAGTTRQRQDILQYLPEEQDVVHEDLLVNANLKKIAIVCMREKQASEAAKMIQARTEVKVSIVSTKVAGTETDHACSCDVVLFVWLATTHAVFRGFDDFDRSKLCYVQGTGTASIVRALERWCKERE